MNHESQQLHGDLINAQARAFDACNFPQIGVLDREHDQIFGETEDCGLCVEWRREFARSLGVEVQW